MEKVHWCYACWDCTACHTAGRPENPHPSLWPSRMRKLKFMGYAFAFVCVCVSACVCARMWTSFLGWLSTFPRRSERDRLPVFDSLASWSDAKELSSYSRASGSLLPQAAAIKVLMFHDKVDTELTMIPRIVPWNRLAYAPERDFLY